jgi:hypothetical protein
VRPPIKEITMNANVNPQRPLALSYGEANDLANQLNDNEWWSVTDDGDGNIRYKPVKHNDSSYFVGIWDISRANEEFIGYVGHF